MGKEDRQAMYLGIFAVLFIAFFAFAGFTGLFSTIGEKPNCEITTPGGTCEIEFVLAQNRAYTSFVTTLGFEGVPDAEFSAFRPITHVSQTGVFLEEDDRDREEEYEQHWWYRIPEQDIYAYAVRASGEGTATSSSTGINARSFIQLQAVETKYIPNDFVTCGRIRSSECRAIFGGVQGGDLFYMFKTGRNNDGEQTFSQSGATQLSPLDGVSARMQEDSDDFVNGLHSGTFPLDVQGTNEPILSTTRTDSFIVTAGWRFERGATASITTKPPQVEYAIKNLNYPSNVNYGINGRFFETLSGEQKEQVQSIDFANLINDECGRNRNVDVCTFTMTFRSSSIGKVVIEEEVSNVQIVELEEVAPPVEEEPTDMGGDEPGNQITGFSIRSLIDEPTEQFIALGIVFILVVGGVLFLPLDKLGMKKK